MHQESEIIPQRNARTPLLKMNAPSGNPWSMTARCDGNCGGIGNLYEYSNRDDGKIHDPVFFCENCLIDHELDQRRIFRLAAYECGAVD
jgi:hypothetical protein